MMHKPIRNFAGVFILILSQLTYAEAKFDGGSLAVRLPNNQTFGYYNIQKVIVRASCFGRMFSYAHHHELYNTGDISKERAISLATKNCRDANRFLGVYELKFITPAGEYKCGSINTRGDIHGVIDVRTLEKFKGFGLTHCSWTYNGHRMDPPDDDPF